MARTHRQAISPTAPQIAYLKAIAKRHGITVAEVIRRIISEHMDAHETEQGRSIPFEDCQKSFLQSLASALDLSYEQLSVGLERAESSRRTDIATKSHATKGSKK